MKLEPGGLTLAGLATFAKSREKVTLDSSDRARLQAGADAVRRMVAEGKAVYGINTGFGKLAQTRIPRDELARLQRNLVLSHAAGTGPHLSDATVRLVLALAGGHLTAKLAEAPGREDEGVERRDGRVVRLVVQVQAGVGRLAEHQRGAGGISQRGQARGLEQHPVRDRRLSRELLDLPAEVEKLGA